MNIASEHSASERYMRGVATSNAPSASGHYSQAVVANGFVFVAGQLPLHPSTREVPAGPEEQTRQALSNVAAILTAAGSGLDKVVTATVFVSDIVHWEAIDTIWADIFGAHRPARAVAVSPKLHFDCLVEIQVMAVA